MPWIKDKDGKWVDVPGSGGGSVTKSKVVAALGYTPAKQADVDDLKEATADKADKTGWTANKYLGTDSSGNMVEKEAPQTGTGGITEETDPTVPSWAKAAKKPTYSKSEVGLGSVDNVRQYSASNPPPYPVTSVNGKTGEASLSASDVGALPSGTKIPAKTSDITNDSGFITKAVADLTNYYTKSQTYTQAEVNALVSAIPKFAISVVASLPTSGISTTTIYLVKSGSGTDLYTEYIYTGGAWEILGSQRVDLTGYATQEWVNMQIADFLTADDLTGAMVTGALGYTPAKQTDVDDLSEAIADYQGQLDGKQPKGNYLTEVPDEYVTETELESEIDDLKAQGVQQTPLFAESVEWLNENGDTSKVYVLPDGYIYGYIKTATEGETVPNFTNLMDNPNAYIRDKERYSNTSSAFKGCDTDCAVVIPITSGTHTIRVRGAGSGGAYTSSFYYGDNNQKFSYVIDSSQYSRKVESNGDIVMTVSQSSSAVKYCVFHVEAGVNADTLIVTVDEEITYTTTEGGYAYNWANTGRAFVPADYESRIIEAEEKLNEHEDRLDFLERNQTTGLSLEHNSCSIFRKVVCCGDSFTAGYIGTNNDNIIQTNWDYAWPSFMARLTGNEYVNCGHSGKDVLTWQTSAKGLPRAQAAGKAQAYLLGLGLNDASLVTLGTASDIGTEAQTYYGGLSKIIRELNAISPTAKIFVQTIPSDYVVYMNYSQAMREVVNAYKDTYPVHLLDLYEYRSMYKTSKLTGDAIMGHYSPIGYQQFAENLRYVWSDYINQHISEFQDVYLIPYDETPSTL